MLQLKRGAPVLFSCLAGAAIVLAMAKVGVAVSLESLMSIGMVIGAVIGGIADGVLLCVAASSDKKMFVN